MQGEGTHANRHDSPAQQHTHTEARTLATHRGPHFLGTHAALCHPIAQWRDRPRARKSKRQRHSGGIGRGQVCGKDNPHIGVYTLWGPMMCYAMLCRSGGIDLGQVTAKDNANMGAPYVLETHAVLCHAVAQWRDRHRA
eukprot:6483041-Pyramimonas_sp.AAC.1